MKAEGLVVISMYTKNPQIRFSLLDYSHFSINFSFDVLDGLFRQCPSYINMLTARSCTTVLLLSKKIFFFLNAVFLVVVIKFLRRGFLFSDRLRTVRESAWQNFMQCILLESGKLYGKGRSLNC